MPVNAVYVGRPTKWGNPYHLAFFNGNVARALETYRLYMAHRNSEDLRSHLHELRGKDLACWCPLDQPCHADVLLELANR